MKKLIVKNFGQFDDLEFILDKRYYVLVGEQASGKSTLAKLVYLFRNMADLYKIISYGVHIKENWNEDNLESFFYKVIIRNFKSCFANDLFNNDSKLQYYYSVEDDRYILIEFDINKNLTVTFSKNILSDLSKIAQKLNSILVGKNDEYEIYEIMRVSVEKEIREVFRVEEDSLYIPAARSLIGLMNDYTYNFMQSTAIDYPLKTFKSAIKALKDLDISIDLVEAVKKDVIDASQQENIIQLMKKILKGKYLIVNDKEYIETDGKKIPFLLSSSGQQEAVWIINFIVFRILANSKFSYVIEEPEAHLFPEAQYNIMKLIMMGANLVDGEVFITTHSPYILNTLNVLMYSGKVEKYDSQNPVIEKECRIKPDQIGVYHLHDGILEDIIDPDEHLIMSEKIDEVSFKLNDLFEAIMDLDFKGC